MKWGLGVVLWGSCNWQSARVQLCGATCHKSVQRMVSSSATINSYRCAFPHTRLPYYTLRIERLIVTKYCSSYSSLETICRQYALVAPATRSFRTAVCICLQFWVPGHKVGPWCFVLRIIQLAVGACPAIKNSKNASSCHMYMLQLIPLDVHSRTQDSLATQYAEITGRLIFVSRGFFARLQIVAVVDTHYRRRRLGATDSLAKMLAIVFVFAALAATVQGQGMQPPSRKPPFVIVFNTLSIYCWYNSSRTLVLYNSVFFPSSVALNSPRAYWG